MFKNILRLVVQEALPPRTRGRPALLGFDDAYDDIVRVLRTGTQWRHLRPTAGVAPITVFKTMHKWIDAGRLPHGVRAPSPPVPAAPAAALLLRRLHLCQERVWGRLRRAQPDRPDVWPPSCRRPSTTKAYRTRSFVRLRTTRTCVSCNQRLRPPSCRPRAERHFTPTKGTTRWPTDAYASAMATATVSSADGRPTAVAHTPSAASSSASTRGWQRSRPLGGGGGSGGDGGTVHDI